MTREEVLDRIREHLATELEVDRDRIGETTRFREDLEADSLDLVELVVELEDSYGVRIPDEEAAKILTVGQAADYVAAHARRDRDLRPLRSCSRSCRRTFGGRPSPTRRGSSTARRPTSGSRSWGTWC